LKNFSIITRYLAAAVLVAYGIFTWWMVREADHPEVYWSRLVFLFEGLEAIVFAAAGLIFGTSIHRSQLEQAQDRERNVRQQAEQYKVDAEVGRGLEAAVRTQAATGRSGDTPPPRSERIGSPGAGASFPNVNGDSALASYLVRLADELKAQASGQGMTG
jgi:hypothetical protein